MSQTECRKQPAELIPILCRSFPPVVTLCRNYGDVVLPGLSSLLSTVTTFTASAIVDAVYVGMSGDDSLLVRLVASKQITMLRHFPCSQLSTALALKFPGGSTVLRCIVYKYSWNTHTVFSRKHAMVWCANLGTCEASAMLLSSSLQHMLIV